MSRIHILCLSIPVSSFALSIHPSGHLTLVPSGCPGLRSQRGGEGAKRYTPFTFTFSFHRPFPYVKPRLFFLLDITFELFITCFLGLSNALLFGSWKYIKRSRVRKRGKDNRNDVLFGHFVQHLEGPRPGRSVGLCISDGGVDNNLIYQSCTLFLPCLTLSPIDLIFTLLREIHSLATSQSQSHELKCRERDRGAGPRAR